MTVPKAVLRKIFENKINRTLNTGWGISQQNQICFQHSPHEKGWVRNLLNISWNQNYNHMVVNGFRQTGFELYCEFSCVSWGDCDMCKSLHTADKRRVELLYGSWYVSSVRCRGRNPSRIQGRHKVAPRCERACEGSVCSPWWILYHIKCTCMAFPLCGYVCESAARRRRRNPCHSPSTDMVSLRCGSLCVCSGFLTQRNVSHSMCTEMASRLCDCACEASDHVCSWKLCHNAHKSVFLVACDAAHGMSNWQQSWKTSRTACTD